MSIGWIILLIGIGVAIGLLIGLFMLAKFAYDSRWRV